MRYSVIYLDKSQTAHSLGALGIPETVMVVLRVSIAFLGYCTLYWLYWMVTHGMIAILSYCRASQAQVVFDLRIKTRPMAVSGSTHSSTTPPRQRAQMLVSGAKQ